jgi:hypothetical protein
MTRHTSGESPATDPVFDTDVYRPPVAGRLFQTAVSVVAVSTVMALAAETTMLTWQKIWIGVGALFLVLHAAQLLTARLVLTTDGIAAESLLGGRRSAAWESVFDVSVGRLPTTKVGCEIPLAIVALQCLAWIGFVSYLPSDLLPWGPPGIALAFFTLPVVMRALTLWWLPDSGLALMSGMLVRVTDRDGHIVASMPGGLSPRELIRLRARCESLGVTLYTQPA